MLMPDVELHPYWDLDIRPEGQPSFAFLSYPLASQNAVTYLAVGAESWSELKQVLKELGLENPDRPKRSVLRSQADCLRI